MKIVRRSMNEPNFNYMRTIRENKEEEQTFKDKEKAALKVIDKIKKDFEDFKKSSKGQIKEYKSFWEQNKKIKELFEDGNIEIYKMFSSDYVAGVLNLPISLLSDGTIDGGMGTTEDEIYDEEKIIEGTSVNETEEDEFDLDLDLDSIDIEDKGSDDLATDTQKTNAEIPNMGSDDTNVDDTSIENTGTVPTTNVTDGIAESKLYFVLYEIIDDEKEEILRTGSSNVIKAFKEFYNDTFKTSMKNAIIKYTEKKKEEKEKAEKGERKKVEKNKESKLKSFLGEQYKTLRNKKLMINEELGIEENLYDEWVTLVFNELQLKFNVIEEDDLDSLDELKLTLKEDFGDILEEYYLDDMSPSDAAEILSIDEYIIDKFTEYGENEQIDESLNESVEDDKEFNAHGYYVISNNMSYLVEVSEDGDMARLKDPDSGEITEWLPIEYGPQEDDEIDDTKEWIPYIDPEHYNIPLNQVMKINR